MPSRLTYLTNTFILFFILPNIEDFPSVQDSLYSITISVPEVYETLISLDVEKSARIDNISCYKVALLLYVNHFIIYFLNH